MIPGSRFEIEVGGNLLNQYAKYKSDEKALCGLPFGLFKLFCGSIDQRILSLEFRIIPVFEIM